MTHAGVCASASSRQRRWHEYAFIAACVGWIAPANAQFLDDARFRESYQRRYDALRGVAPDMVVMELRDRAELVASRGSQVGSATNYRRVRSFESTLLRGLQGAVCGGSAAASVRPSPTVVEKVTAAADANQFRTQSADVAELAALAQRLLDGQPRERWCSLRSLDDIQ